MKPKRIIRYSLYLMVLLAVTACASTKLTSVRKDPGYVGGPVQKVFVMVFATKPTVRNMIENEFVKQLRARGTGAVPGYSIVPFDQMLEKETIASKVKDLGVDAVLITRVIGRKGVRIAGPGETWYDHYNMSFRYVQAPAYTTEEDVVLVETDLYETRTEKLIWSAQSETLAMGIDPGRIKDFVKIMVEKLKEDKLIRGSQ